MSNGMAKNLEVCREEWDMYKRVYASVTYRASQETDIRRKFHVLAGLLPDLYRTMPRTLSYSVALFVPIAALLWWLV